MDVAYDKTIVRSLDKGLAVVEALNVQNGLTIHEIAGATGINRGTAYRLLETLRRRGYIRKAEHEHRYWLEPMVQALASGYKNESWIKEIVQPACEILGRELIWPINFTTYARQGMVVRACSDYESPLTVEKIPIGYCIPFYSSSTGRAYIAFSTEAERKQVMNILFPSTGDKSSDIISPHDVTDVLLRDYDRNRKRDKAYFDHKKLEMVRKLGYDEVEYAPPGLPVRTVISAPVFDEGRLTGILSLRCYTLALTPPRTLDHYVKELLSAAARMGQRLSQRTQVVPN